MKASFSKRTKRYGNTFLNSSLSTIVLGSISSKFYVQLLRPQILKAQKDTDNLTVFFMLSGSTNLKASCKTFVKLTPDVP